jgi:hypothetical protein
MSTHYSRAAIASIALLGLFGHADRAKAATVVEFFNNYGNDGNLKGKGTAGDGWQGAWAGTEPVTPGSVLAPQYDAGVSLNFGSVNYDNSANETGTDDGLANRGAGGTGAHYAARALATGMTGTVWVSALGRYTSNTADAILTLDTTAGTGTSFVPIRDRDAVMRTTIVGGTAITDTNEFGAGGADNVYAADSTYLMLVRIQMNVSGPSNVNDQVDFWIFDNDAATTTVPALPSTAAGLPANPSFSKLGDFYGGTFDAVGVSFEDAGSQIDAIRLSNDANGFEQVTTAVPEPGALSALALGLCCLRRRRR